MLQELLCFGLRTCRQTQLKQRAAPNPTTPPLVPQPNTRPGAENQALFIEAVAQVETGENDDPTIMRSRPSSIIWRNESLSKHKVSESTRTIIKVGKL